MEEVKKMRLIHSPQLEDIPELIHRIQSLLPVEDATRTCVVSKSWLHALSTNPTLRFRLHSVSKQKLRKYIKLMDNTIDRYIENNMQIISFDLDIYIHNLKTAAFAEEWIECAASRSCLGELCLKIFVENASITMPDEIFSCENLNTLSIRVTLDDMKKYSFFMCSKPVVNCASLRVLELINVRMSEEVLDNILSRCSLLEKINLSLANHLWEIRVNNLRCLRELIINPKEEGYSILEIYDVPSLNFFFCASLRSQGESIIKFNKGALGSVRELYLANVSMDSEVSEIINSKFPFLKSLTLKMIFNFEGILDITCVSLRRLIIHLRQNRHMNIRVYATQLLSFRYKGVGIPSLLFLTSAPEYIDLRVKLGNHIDHSLYKDMRKTLDLSSTFRIKIICDKDSVYPPSCVITSFIPATNVQTLTFQPFSHEGLWENSPFFNALLWILRPRYIEVYKGITDEVNNDSWKLTIGGMMKLQTRKKIWRDLKEVEVEDIRNGKWTILKSFWTSFLDNVTYFDWDLLRFRLTWGSPSKLLIIS